MNQHEYNQHNTSASTPQKGRATSDLQQISSPHSVMHNNSASPGPMFGSYNSTVNPNSNRQQQQQQQQPKSIYQPNQYAQMGQHHQHQHQHQYQYSPSAQQMSPTNNYHHQGQPVPPAPIQIASPSAQQYARSSQTTPTNQDIKTNTPSAPMKAPRPQMMDHTQLQQLHQHQQQYQNQHQHQHQNQYVPRRDRSYSQASSTGSALSSTNSRNSRTNLPSILNDPTIAPPPKFPSNLNVIKTRFFGGEQKKQVQSTLPSFELVKHSGNNISARLSIRSMITKKWKDVFWISYGDNQILFFRSQLDFEEWVSNPYLKKDERDALVKLNVDFVNDLYKPSVNGYFVTNVNAKHYNKQGAMHHFKLEKWMDYGPVIIAALSSTNYDDVCHLRRLICDMIEKSPQKKRWTAESGTSSSVYDSDAQSTRSSGASSVYSYKSAVSVKSAPEFKPPSTSKFVNPFSKNSNSNQNNSTNTYVEEEEEKKRGRRSRFRLSKKNGNKDNDDSNHSNKSNKNIHPMLAQYLSTDQKDQEKRAKSVEPPKKRGMNFGRKSSSSKNNDDSHHNGSFEFAGASYVI